MYLMGCALVSSRAVWWSDLETGADDVSLHPPMYHECQVTSIYLVPFVVPVYRRRTAYYNTEVCYDYDLTIYFGAGDGGWMYSTIKYKRRGNSGEGRSIVSGNYGLCRTITRECASERGVDILCI